MEEEIAPSVTTFVITVCYPQCHCLPGAATAAVLALMRGGHRRLKLRFWFHLCVFELGVVV
jgi:hypothetical protein